MHSRPAYRFSLATSTELDHRGRISGCLKSFDTNLFLSTPISEDNFF